MKFITWSLSWCLFFFSDENFLYFYLLTAFTYGDDENSSGFLSFCSNFYHLKDSGFVVLKVSLNFYLLSLDFVSGVNAVPLLLQWLNVFLVEFKSTVRVNLFSLVTWGFIYVPIFLSFYSFDSFLFYSISSVKSLNVVLFFLKSKLSILTWFPSFSWILRAWSSECNMVLRLFKVRC